ncbi:Hexokinase [Pyrenophora tritici-repentis]|uniref:Phosphotransferase n=2 Tax=Pyrenophora tritici-repentis TaxID=45151 RepID=A0A2W1HKX8_9PLEO|nr:glucokinase GLK1 [Pyrenophora tritici-repentis Pt-1C-BFP]KAF7448944.1 Hexokinase [Pyrenophora tritici-repentis]EDU48324.1 glucokinase GLK1 [Pyrenophora tritici-repentis Pt-1C-BFP]KAF7571064.1 Hexokinase [Pyrenophora tritici-repentis]KAG9384117.1 Hexokinase [Pyrenophora tritici-repentis]KAI0579152.1 Hexokinase [Pyrenophora tritici-repentis]
MSRNSSVSSPSEATRPRSSPTQSARQARQANTGTSLVTHTILSLLVLLLALGTAFFAPHLPNAVVRLVTKDHATGFTLRNPIVLQEPSVCPKPEQQVEFVGTFNREHKRSMALADQAKRVAAEFDFSDDALNKAVKEFIREMDEGLVKEGTEMSQIPTYVTAVPNGTEKGLYMAVDLGGTNFRVCSIELHGNTTFSLTQSKVAIPRELMVAKTSKELFSFLAKQIEAFLKLHHEEHYAGTLRRREGKGGEPEDEEIFNLGFTFSFPVHQIGINKGMLMRWTKGFDIQDAVGKDVCALLQQEIDELHLPVKVAALVNDTVGTLMARSYTSPGKTGTLLGAIFGTGTNGAYVEKLDKVSKLTQSKTAGDYDQSTGEMIVNTEWGSFDNSLRTLPNSPYDIELDKNSVNPGIQMFEKRVSGMFLGELLRLALVKLIKDPSVPLFTDDNSSSNDVHSTTQIHDGSPIWKQWGIDTSFLSVCAGDHSPGLRMLRQTLDKDYDISAVSAEDAEAVREIAAAIGRRAARLAAVAIAGVVINTGRLDKSSGSATTEDKSGIAPPRGDVDASEGDEIDVGVDGSLVEFYPNFEEYIREALRAIPEIGTKGEKRVRIGIAKDGSGVGAALIALVAGKVNAPQ